MMTSIVGVSKHDLWKVAAWVDGFSDGVGGLLIR